MSFLGSADRLNGGHRHHMRPRKPLHKGFVAKRASRSIRASLTTRHCILQSQLAHVSSQTAQRRKTTDQYHTTKSKSLLTHSFCIETPPSLIRQSSHRRRGRKIHVSCSCTIGPDSRLSASLCITQLGQAATVSEMAVVKLSRNPHSQAWEHQTTKEHSQPTAEASKT